MANATGTSKVSVPSDRDCITERRSRKTQSVTAIKRLYAIVLIPIPATNCGQEVSVKRDRKVQIKNKILNPY